MEAFPFIQQFGAVSVAGLVAIAVFANLFPGIPEELPLLGIGVAIGSNIVPFHFAFLVVFATLFIVDNIMYLLARRGSRIIVFAQRKIFGNSIDVQSDFIKTHLEKIVFISRFIVHVRFLGIFLAGINKMSWKRFAIIEASALGLYLAILLSIGAYFHGRIERMLDGVGLVKNIIVIALVFLVLIIIARILYIKVIRHLRGEKESRIFTALGFSKTKR